MARGIHRVQEAGGAQPTSTCTPRPRRRHIGSGLVGHPKMFDDDDPQLARVREIARMLPGAAEKISHGRPALYTKKVFAYYGGSLKQGDEWIQHPQSLVVLLDQSEREALLEEQRCYVPAYLGPSGWIGIDLDESTESAEIAELLDASYRSTAPKRYIEQLDSGD